MKNYDKMDKINSLDSRFNSLQNIVKELRSDVRTFYNNNHIETSKSVIFGKKLDKVVELILDSESIYRKQVEETRQIIQEIVYKG